MTNKTILVVEDTYFNQVLVDSIIADLGYNVILSDEGEDALDKLNSNPIDLIILDLMMPGMDGFQFLREKQKLGDNTPVIVLTARNDSESINECEVLGVNAYITKPFNMAEFAERIKSILEK